MKLKRILIYVLIAVVIIAGFTIGIEILKSKANKPKTITNEPIVVTIEPTTTETGEEDKPSEEVVEPGDNPEADNPETDPNEEVEPIIHEGEERVLVNTETDPSKVVVPDDTHDELAIRVKAIQEDESDSFEITEGSEVAEGQRQKTSDGPNIGLLVLLGLLVVAFVGVFIYRGKMQNGGGGKSK